MEPVISALNKNINKGTGYLPRLHFPTTMSSKSLSAPEWMTLVGTGATVSLIAWLTYQKFFKSINGIVNPNIQKDSPKVVHGFDIEDLGDKVAFCRCWRSAKFPYCDGSHTEHNRITGDNVGPVCLKRRDK